MVGEKAVGNKSLIIAKNIASAAINIGASFYLERFSFFRAALAPSFPRAARVVFGKCAIVLFRRAALAAFLMFRLAAARCCFVAISATEQVSQLKAFAQVAFSH